MVALVLSSCQAAVRASPASALGPRRQQARRLSAVVPKASTEEQASTPVAANTYFYAGKSFTEAEVRGLSALRAACAAPNGAPLHAFRSHASFGQLVWLCIDWCGWGVRTRHPNFGHLPPLAACTTNSHASLACIAFLIDVQWQKAVADGTVAKPAPASAADVAAAATASAPPSLSGVMAFAGPGPGECTCMPA